MKSISEEAMQQLRDIGERVRTKLSLGEALLAHKELENAWEVIPEPKAEYDISLSILVGAIRLMALSNKPDLAFLWVHRLRDVLIPEIDSEPDFVTGLAYFETGKKDKAFLHFDNAYKLSDGHCFDGEDKKYITFYKSRIDNTSFYRNTITRYTDTITELDDKTYEMVSELSEKGNRYMRQGKWDKAVDSFRKAMDVLPEPRNQWEAATWLNVAIGEALFAQGKFPSAKDYFFEAFNCPSSTGNPFIHLRLGATLYELREYEGATEHLLRAYMLEGTNIFAHEDPKYFSFLKEHVDL